MAIPLPVQAVLATLSALAVLATAPAWSACVTTAAGAGGGTMGARVTAVLSRFTTAWATQLPPEAIIGACEEAGYPAWRDRVRTPLTTIQLLL